jgi:hypothetical protein
MKQKENVDRYIGLAMDVMVTVWDVLQSGRNVPFWRNPVPLSLPTK